MSEACQKLWTKQDVMAFARFKSRNKLYKLISAGMPCIRVGGNLLFNEDDVIQFFMDHQQIKKGSRARA